MNKIPNISKRICDSCGKDLPDGMLFYHCRTELVAAKDASVPNLQHPDKLIAQALSEIAGKDENDLLDEIYQELILQLCPNCRAAYLKLVHSMLNNDCKTCNRCNSQPTKKEGKLLKFPGKTDKDN